MSITLKKANREDMHDLWEMQVEAFKGLLEKFQEKGNLHIYKKIGYRKTGKIEKISNQMDIVYYEKN